jgi:Xaa-Pro aminopeptidase
MTARLVVVLQLSIVMIDFQQIRTRLDSGESSGMRNTPYYQDAVYPKFSPAEYERRYKLTREKMARLGLDCLIVGGAPSHWSFGSGVLWLTNHREWHSIAVYLVVPLEGEPTFIYSMDGTHAEATRRAVVVQDVRDSIRGRFMQVAAERIIELGLDKGKIGLTCIDPQYLDYMPVNQYQMLRAKLPNASFERVGDFFHEFFVVKSAEEQEYVRRAGKLCVRAIEAIANAARPRVTEYQLKSAATFAILDAGGEVDFMIIGSGSMHDPAIVFGNPRPSGRTLHEGDIILNELAAGFEGYTAQIGVPVCIGSPTRQVRQMFDEIVLPGYQLMAEQLRPGKTIGDLWRAGQFFRQNGYQTRPTHLHGMDLVTHAPHVTAEPPDDHEAGLELKPGMEMMLEPNPITLDGKLGLFFGHTVLINATGHERVTNELPLEMIVVG